MATRGLLASVRCRVTMSRFGCGKFANAAPPATPSSRNRETRLHEEGQLRFMFHVSRFTFILIAMIEKIFKAYDVRATYPNPLNEDAAWKVGHATAQFLKRNRDAQAKVQHPETILVGRDMRPHSPALAAALSAGIRSVGMNVVDVGMIATSFIYFAINHLDAVGGIMTTASHNPVQYNGFKISGPKAKPIGSASGLDDIKRIATTLTQRANTGLKGKYEEQNLWPDYRKHVL